MAGAIPLKIAYGYTADSQGQDPLIHELEEAMKLAVIALQPAGWLVDSFPFRENLHYDS